MDRLIITDLRQIWDRLHRRLAIDLLGLPVRGMARWRTLRSIY
jgi:hypothetical protein